MPTKKATFKAEWDEETEKKIESKFSEWAKKCDKKDVGSSAGAGAVYGFGLVGALIHFIQNAETFGEGVVGVLKALVWPAMIVYYLLESLGL
mgnify:CR=1 FL=1